MGAATWSCPTCAINPVLSRQAVDQDEFHGSRMALQAGRAPVIQPSLPPQSSTRASSTLHTSSSTGVSYTSDSRWMCRGRDCRVARKSVLS